MSAKPLLPSLPPVDHAAAQGDQKTILDTALKQVGFLPNMYLGMANAPAVLSTYLHGYSLFRTESGFTAPEQEVVFLAVSEVNGCNYCTAAHSMIADKKSGVPADVLKAIRGRSPIPDARLAALYLFTIEMVRTHGRPPQSAIESFFAAGFSQHQFLYIILAISVKTLSNFSNHAFATPLDSRFEAYKLS